MHGMPQNGHTRPTTPRILCIELTMPCAEKMLMYLWLRNLTRVKFRTSALMLLRRKGCRMWCVTGVTVTHHILHPSRRRSIKALFQTTYHCSSSKSFSKIMFPGVLEEVSRKWHRSTLYIYIYIYIYIYMYMWPMICDITLYGIQRRRHGVEIRLLGILFGSPVVSNVISTCVCAGRQTCWGVPVQSKHSPTDWRRGGRAQAVHHRPGDRSLSELEVLY